MMFYVEITGYIKNHKNFKFLFWSLESEKMIFTIFPENFYEKMGWKYGITSETTITESRVRRRFRKSRVRRRKPRIRQCGPSDLAEREDTLWKRTQLSPVGSSQEVPPFQKDFQLAQSDTRNRGRHDVSVVSLEIPGIVVSLEIP